MRRIMRAKRKPLVPFNSVLSVLLLSCVCAQFAFPLHVGAQSYVLTDPLAEPRMFAEGIVNTSGNEFGGVFTPDGHEFYFTRSVPRSYLYVICVSYFKNGKWSEPEIAPFSGRYRDFDAVISPDGKQMFFISDRPVNGRPKTDYDIWVMDRTAAGWSEPKHPDAPINTDANEWFVSAARGSTLYISSSRASGAANGKGEIFRTRLVNGKYSEPEKLPDTINAGVFVTEGYVAPDESFILFSSYGLKGGFGGYDIYISYHHSDTWTEPLNLGAKVNTGTRDYSPRLTPDGKYLFFTSERNFSTRPLERPLSYRELENALDSTLSGNGNIYQIELSSLGVKR